MAETREGGVYRVGDEFQNANGEKVSAPRGAAPKAGGKTAKPAAGGEGGQGEPGPLDGINFASDEAAEAASKAGLTAEKFAGVTGSGSEGGFTMADVKKLAEPAA